MQHIFNTFVSIGNAKQPFIRLLNLIASHIDLLPKPILIQTGHTNFRTKYAKVERFIDMDLFPFYIKHAKIIILHGGAGSSLHAIQQGKTPILIPRRASFREQVNDHQYDFSKKMHELKLAIMVENTIELVQAIALVLNGEFMLNTKKNNIACKTIKELLLRLSN